jgi:hypothetical protein
MVVTAAPPIDVVVRCDRCPARAQFTIIMPSGGELEMCTSHLRFHRRALSIQNAAIINLAAMEDLP